ncbi:hypothetical protein ACKI10_17470 [Streptomyces galilaeus]|uniref:DUF2591 domain-containing protein n=1 Tax=Streptomyces galilaeus TaxID=33899 RepID=A0ABW9IPL0_STRGJ
MRDLTVETRQQENRTPVAAGLALTPPLGQDYWSHRVRITDRQAIVAFPKFSSIGIGFAVEAEDWNCNLPYRCDAEEIYEHIEPNKGDDAISRETCIAAIRLLQGAIQAQQEGSSDG